MPFPRSHRGVFPIPSEASAARFLSLLAFKLRRRGASDIEHVASQVAFQVEYEQRGQAGPLFAADGGRVEVLLTNGVPVAAYEISTQSSALILATGAFGGFGVIAYYVFGVPIAFAGITTVLAWFFLFGTAYAISRAVWQQFLATTIEEITARPHH